jgi:hypothetical protein
MKRRLGGPGAARSVPDVTDIRHIATHAWSDARFLTAEFEHHVRLWSLADWSLVAELDTVLDFGGQRLALCETRESPVIVAGAWERDGICAYAPDGTRLWHARTSESPSTSHQPPTGRSWSPASVSGQCTFCAWSLARWSPRSGPSEGSTTAHTPR